MHVSANRRADGPPVMRRLGVRVRRVTQRWGTRLGLDRTGTTDALTGLATRAVLATHGPRVLHEASRHGDVAGVIFFDLDSFKWVNDTFGHAAGDAVLHEVGARVRSTLRDTDLAVRLGGDEFAVVLAGLPTIWAAESVTARLQEALAPGVPHGETTIEVRASMGTALLGLDGLTLPELLDVADARAYAAKRDGDLPWQRQHRDGARTGARLTAPVAPSADALRRVLRDGGLGVHLQPQVDARDGTLVGFEALARWDHPRLGLLHPRDIVPLVEREGLTRELTECVLDQALACHAELRREHPDSRIAVNISTRALLDERLPSQVQGLLERHGSVAQALTVEITEPSVSPSAAVGRALESLASLGCRLGLHEYGTGQTSLTSVATNRAVRELKLAPALAGQVVHDADARRLVRAVVSMAHSLELDVVGEGVESAEVAVALRELGCDVLQGFHIQAPAPLAEVMAWARTWPTAGVAALRLGPQPA